MQAARHQGPHRRGDLPEPAKPAGRRNPQAVPLFTQLLLALSKNEAKYGTTGTPRQILAGLEEEVDEALEPYLKPPLCTDKKTGFRRPVRVCADGSTSGKRNPVRSRPRTARLFTLCRPERLLDLTFNFTLFDGGEKKVARYQQFFSVKKILDRIRERDERGPARAVSSGIPRAAASR